MNVKNIAKNFGHPRGKVGERVGLWLIENKPCYDQLFEFIEASPNSRILEIGYGPGYGINDLYKTTGCFIDGIDISKEMYIKARTLNSDGIRLFRLPCGAKIPYPARQSETRWPCESASCS